MTSASSDITSKVIACLYGLIEEAIEDTQGASLISKRDRNTICDRSLSETAIKRRVELHAEAWVEDAVSYAKKLVKQSAAGRIEHALRAGKLRNDTNF